MLIYSLVDEEKPRKETTKTKKSARARSSPLHLYSPLTPVRVSNCFRATFNFSSLASSSQPFCRFIRFQTLSNFIRGRCFTISAPRSTPPAWTSSVPGRSKQQTTCTTCRVRFLPQRRDVSECCSDAFRELSPFYF